MRSRASITAAVLAAVCFSVVGCGSDGEEPEPEPQAVAWPFTGLDGMSGGEVDGAITVKIENTPGGRPQVGIDAADIVVEQLVEGGLTRLAAVYHSQFPAQAGPVRSLRETDIGIVLPTEGTLAASGGAASTLAEVNAAGVPTALEGGAPGFSRDPGRRPPYDVMLDVAQLSGSQDPAPPPEPYLPFGAVPDAATGAPAEVVGLRWPSSRTGFAYDAASGLYVRSDLPDATGFAFTNVIAVSVPVVFSGGTDASGTRVPTMVTSGTGTGYVATAGTVYEVNWSKGSDEAPWDFSYAQGSAARQPFTVPPGRTWLALLPVDGGSATFDAAAPIG